MSIYMNSYDLDRAYHDATEGDTPNLKRAVDILARLIDWSDHNSEGWSYWQKPKMAAQRLMALIQNACREPWEGITDITEAELRAALTPIKRFLTTREVEHSLILDDPEPYCNHDEPALVDQGDGTVKCECEAILRPVTVYTAVS